MLSLLAARARKNHSLNYYNVVHADSPLGYWRLGETSGTTSVDSGSGGNAGTYVSCTLGAASLIQNNAGNLAVNMNGTSSQVTVGAVAALYGLSRNCSIEAWIKPSAVASTYGIWSAGLAGICVRQNGTNLELLSDYSASIHTFTANFVANTIYHVVLTINGSGACTAYVNGISIGTFTTTTNFTGAYVRIGADGRDSTTVSSFFSGILDEVAVYNTALTSTQVNSHYLAGT